MYSELEVRVQQLQSQLLHKEAQVNPALRENERLKQEIENLMSPQLTFNQTTGTYVGSTGLHYCMHCLSDDKRSPLKNEAHGWRCMVCRARFADPERPWPSISLGHDPLA